MGLNNILITGGTGMVGSSFKKVKKNYNFVYINSSHYDLRDKSKVDEMFSNIKPDAVIHLAAKVGGVKGNSEFISDFYHDNILINTNVLNCARQFKVNKVVSLLSTCIYPDNVTYPLTEDKIHSGPPHESNFGYAYAKRMLDIHSQAIRKQYGLNYITAVPNNIYGENDNFDLENGHVIPAIIRKIYEAKLSQKPPVFWGSGSPLREFTYSVDVAHALLFLLENYDGEKPINIGKTGEISIKDIVHKISNIMGYHGELIWDTNMPEGQYRKPSSNNRFLNMCKNFSYTNIDIGLKNTCEWFIKKYPNVRGIN
jgi:GDP-L-fucose synthase